MIRLCDFSWTRCCRSLARWFPGLGTALGIDFSYSSHTKNQFLKYVSVSWVLVGAIAALNFVFIPYALADNYNKESLIDVDFSGRVLTDSSFTKANLRSSNLSHTDLRGVSFFGANLEDVNLEEANLSFATLDSARLVGANLTNAILEGAFAFNAKFDRAILDGADFTDVLLRQDTQDKLCETATGTNPITGRKTRDTLDCF